MTIEPRPLTAERFWIVCDGPPGPEPGRFVEVENDRHESVGMDGRRWEHDTDLFWRLGPFVSEAALLHTEAERDFLTAQDHESERTIQRLNDLVTALERERDAAEAEVDRTLRLAETEVTQARGRITALEGVIERVRVFLLDIGENAGLVEHLLEAQP